MNYITKLQEIKLEAREYNEKAQAAMLELISYLQSSKFWNDPTVQVKDVMNRLEPIRDAMNMETDILKA
jgi:hypothetical protein